MQADLTRCGVVVSRNTHICHTHLWVNEHLQLWKALENGVGDWEGANPQAKEEANYSAVTFGLPAERSFGGVW